MGNRCAMARTQRGPVPKIGGTGALRGQSLWRAVRKNRMGSLNCRVDAARSQAGSSIIEFIFLVVLLLVPLVYLVVGASQVQAASYAAVGAADHAAKVFVTAETEGQGQTRAADAVRRASANMEIRSDRTHFSYSCRGSCLSPGSTVTVKVSIDTVLPLLPEGWSWRTGNVGSTATQRVDRYG